MPRAEQCVPTFRVGATKGTLYALIAVLALTQGGCLLALVGVAGGAAATGFFYFKGRIYHDFPAPFPDVLNAVRASLLDLHFAIFADEPKDGKAIIVTKTTQGKKVRIYIDCLHSPIPSEGMLTRVSIRVACFGDESISTRIFEQVGFRLSHPGPVAPAPMGPAPVGAPAPIQQTGFQTTEPKLAPDKKN
ncbi:MAG TPA: DUF3568 family protein [Gemmataceae bacterium]|nr:DUF3568 family protein [Gemmataceae bacterium]